MTLETRRIEVTAEDIAHGRRNSPYSCPIARAASRVLVGPDVVVDGIYIEFGEDQLVELPVKAKWFAAKFDEKGRAAVKPFGFTVRWRP